MLFGSWTISLGRLKISLLKGLFFKHAIMHLSDIVKVMDEVYRLLNDDGTVEILAPH